jgi:hypothetical protein
VKIPAPWPVLHIPRTVDTTKTDGHGNHPIIDGAPIIRWVYSYHQPGGAAPSSSEVITPEFLDRIETTLDMAVPNPADYHASDGVILGGTIDEGGAYEGGTQYWVNGDPTNDFKGPFKKLYAWAGGVVKLRRVT